MELLKNGLLPVLESTRMFKRFSTLTVEEKALLLKTCQNITLLGEDTSNAKLAKNEKFKTDYISYILYLSPAESAFEYVSKRGNLCPNYSEACKIFCLAGGGRAKMDVTIENGVTLGRLRKTLYYIFFPVEFKAHLDKEIKRVKKKIKKAGKRLALRLNGTSDISWKRFIVEHNDVQFYDYSAVPKRVMAQKLLDNYHLTFSWKGNNIEECLEMLQAGVNVAIPFSPELYASIGDTIEFYGHTVKVIDGSEHDMRFLDKTDSFGYIVKLEEIVTRSSMKQRDCSGFIVRDLSQLQTRQVA